MPIWVAALIGGLIQACSSLVGRVLVAAGFIAVSYTGISTSLEWARVYTMTQFQGLPSIALQLAGLARVGETISIIASAYGARWLLQGLTGGTITRLVQKPLGGG